MQIAEDLLKNVLLLLFLIPLELTISLPFKLHITMETANENTSYEKKKTPNKPTKTNQKWNGGNR